ncbi:M10 family metallopeptidase C-terminal domain-containing protein [Salipiger sp.]|uniref:M10 family metallopeptidase C-terminal domain-containing protein n=1 Tax=Salipiger sp. TaxID=2078585 RepID=UPI003A96A87D
MANEPSPQEQLLLELMNRARANPLGEYDALILDAARGIGATPGITDALGYFGVDLALLYRQLAAMPSVAPLAWNGALAVSADRHNALMIANDQQSHVFPNEDGLQARFSAAGYSGGTNFAENIFLYGTALLQTHAAFVIDWGGNAASGGMQSPPLHREVMLGAQYREVGISVISETDPSTGAGPVVVTQNFGSRSDYLQQLVGVVIDDLDGDSFYDPGEGMGGVTVTAVGDAGVYHTTSWASGGYQLALPAGRYTVVFSGGALDGVVTAEIVMRGANVKLDAEADDAVPESGPGADMVFGTVAGEELSGLGGADTLLAFGGHDTLRGGAANDSLDGGGGNDLLLGGEGDDILAGGAGQDSLTGGAGADVLDGGAGIDMAVYEAAGGRVLVDLLGDVSGAGYARFYDAGASEGDTYAGIENIAGGRFSDHLRGDDGDNRIEGGPGWDRLYGRQGNDSLFGGPGSDVLYGNGGADLLSGGRDGQRDRFVYFTALDSGVGLGNRDVIVDFEEAVDRIEISRLDADITQPFKQDFTFVGAHRFSGTAGELRSVVLGDRTLVQADLDGDGVSDFDIELSGAHTLTVDNFVL